MKENPIVEDPFLGFRKTVFILIQLLAEWSSAMATGEKRKRKKERRREKKKRLGRNQRKNSGSFSEELKVWKVWLYALSLQKKTEGERTSLCVYVCVCVYIALFFLFFLSTRFWAFLLFFFAFVLLFVTALGLQGISSSLSVTVKFVFLFVFPAYLSLFLSLSLLCFFSAAESFSLLLSKGVRKKKYGFPRMLSADISFHFRSFSNRVR